MSRRRRPLLAMLLAVAALFALSLPRPRDAPATVAVVTAARDLPTGRLLTHADLTTTHLPSTALPDGALRDPPSAEGRLLAAPARRGEVITDHRLLGEGLLREYAEAAGSETVAAPVRIADGAAASLLTPGDVIDVLAPTSTVGSPGAAPGAEVVASRATVITVLTGRESTAAGDGLIGGAGGDPDPLLLLAVSSETATALAGAGSHAGLAFALHGRE
ncbi:RcpC/CpaB family pilus assembly protein [Allostreptomyces psammosilenae]|uniref:Flp pilus assembly protein CpaB n=1 Tax=Allostreptomyces psammosilenae TaxID=1892865 RepID=A0A853A053_9ACTN|nr:RcpC/CpaB family pilus assembly protein [Allostreptomyces psammosilenae]NYI07769.1 Flp pilus assembly protein CpaB [Allostreptomyces psammosilenae]